MINFVIGEVVGIEDGLLVVSNNGIGFEINVSNKTLSDFSLIGEVVTVYTYIQVREDDVSLFGFSTKEEKKMFLMLISVNGVGPKMALQILSGIRPDDLSAAIVSEDAASLVRIKGLGKKTAERIVLELKGKISPMEVLLTSKKGVSVFEPAFSSTGDQAEALAVLLSLGMTRAEAQRHIADAVKNGCSSSEDIVRYAIRHNV